MLQKRSKTKSEEFNALLNLAMSAQMRGDRSVADDSLSRALALAEQTGSLALHCHVRKLQCSLALQFRDFPAAKGFCTDAESVLQVLKIMEPHDIAIVQLTYLTQIIRAQYLHCIGKEDTSTAIMESSHRSLLAYAGGVDGFANSSKFVTRGGICGNILEMAAMMVRSPQETCVSDGKYWMNKAIENSQGNLLGQSLRQIAEIRQEIDPSDPEILLSLDKAEKLAHDEGQHDAMLLCLMIRSKYFKDNERWEEAELCTTKTIRIAMERGQPEHIAVSTSFSADVAYGMNNYMLAIERYENAARLYAALPNRHADTVRCRNISLDLRKLMNKA